MNQKVSPKIISLAFGILVICFVVAFYIVAWQEPSQAPPEGNVPTPLNVGSTAQTKAGDLTIQGFLSTLKDFVVGNTTIKNDGSISPNLNSDKLDDYHAADLLAGGGSKLKGLFAYVYVGTCPTCFSDENCTIPATKTYLSGAELFDQTGSSVLTVPCYVQNWSYWEGCYGCRAGVPGMKCGDGLTTTCAITGNPPAQYTTYYYLCTCTE